jgi:hypothetical protein
MHLRHLLLIAALATLLPLESRAESAVAYVDLSLDFKSFDPPVWPDQMVEFELMLSNSGDFAAEQAQISMPLPEALSLVSAATEFGNYDPELGLWTTRVSPYQTTSLLLTVLVDSSPPPVIGIVADLKSYQASFEAFDPDSTPDNANPCEDDYAVLHLRVGNASATRHSLDAGLADAGPSCPDPPNPPRGKDAGADAPGAGDGGNDIWDPPSSSSGCSVTNTQAANAFLPIVVLLMLLMLLMGARKREISRAD